VASAERLRHPRSDTPSVTVRMSKASASVIWTVSIRPARLAVCRRSAPAGGHHRAGDLLDLRRGCVGTEGVGDAVDDGADV
jgi:hypothetical protein